LEDLYRRYGDRFEFLAIYVREAHPTDGWRMASNDKAGISVKQPTKKDDRVEVAGKCCSTLGITMPVLVDEMDDRVGHAYSGMPDRLYVIDKAGKVAFKSGRGPFGFKPGEMEQAMIMLLLDQEKPKPAPARVPVLDDKEAWKVLPAAEEGAGQPLPVWIRALAGSLPKTAAAMINLDYVQRTENPLPPRIRARLRWVAADVNRCEYARVYARADYVRSGGKSEDLDDLTGKLDKLPEDERLALQLVRQLGERAYTVTDAQMARLVKLYGEEKVVAIVLVAAYANFQDRLLLALGVEVEKGGPLPPVKVRFRKPPPQATSKDKDSPKDKAKEAPKRKLSPPAKNPPQVPEKVDDPEWTAVSFDTLRDHLKDQMASRPGRIRIPTWETVLDNLPEGAPKPEKPSRIIWSLVTMGYQPKLSMPWSAGLRAFREESDLDAVFHESMFWVVTRSLQCFY
jgi:alkylhydroperoxidase family enzyme